MKVFISILLLVLICLVQEASVMLLEVRSNIDVVEAKVNAALGVAGKLQGMSEWFDKVPIQNKVAMVLK